MGERGHYLSHKPLYATARWQKLRLRALRRDGWGCVLCRREGVETPAREVDHLIPVIRAPDLFWDIDNLQALCFRHHCLKTAGENRAGAWEKKRVGMDPMTGRPLTGRNA